MKDNKFNKYFMITFILLAILIVAYVIFKYPLSGVADQGDFDRVMFGLSVKDSDINNPDFIRFYKYIITDYSINLSFVSVFLMLTGSTMNYLIFVIICICKLFGQSIFKTQYLAIAYAAIYIFAVFRILKNIEIKNHATKIILGILSLFILFDGYYIIWFNSLYGEPIMISTFLLFIGAYLTYINEKYSDNNDHLKSKIVFVFICAFLFYGSKMQVSTTLPFFLIILIKIIIDNRKVVSKKFFSLMCVMLLLVVLCPIKMGAQGSAQGKDTLYNSVFYGILNESDTPRQDLIDLGLNPDMACEAGKHAYLNKEDYVKYVPRTEITEDEFYSKMGNSKLAIFYLTHPKRLIEGMKYTADHAFYTSTSLGKHYRSYSEEPIREFHRFTLWSTIRENYLPKNLLFIISVFVIAISIIIYEFFKNKQNLKVKNILYLILAIVFAGAIQFPMPFVGNGKADTAKQLYLFNFVFDLVLIGIIIYILNKVFTLIVKRIKLKG